MLSIILTMVAASSWVFFIAESSPGNETVIPNYFCDLEYEGTAYIYNCSIALLPEKAGNFVATRLHEYTKDTSLSQWVAEVCKTSPKLFSSAFRMVQNAMETKFQAVTKTVLHTCWNATVYWLPRISETRYQDIGLYFS